MSKIDAFRNLCAMLGKRCVFKVYVQHRVVDGVHFFTSHEVPGLCAAHRDPRRAFDAVAIQLKSLTKEPFEPERSFDEWATDQSDTVIWVLADAPKVPTPECGELNPLIPLRVGGRGRNSTA